MREKIDASKIEPCCMNGFLVMTPGYILYELGKELN